MGDLTFNDKREIIFALRGGRTKDPEVAYVSKLYSMQQMGFNIPLESITEKQLKMMMYMAEEQQRNAQKNARMNK